jgi:hypothetical protein
MTEREVAQGESDDQARIRWINDAIREAYTIGYIVERRF